MKERFRKDGKKAIHRFLFSRIIILILMLLAQLAVFYATFVWLVKVQTAVMTCLTLLSIGVIIYIVNDKSNPSFKLWLLLTSQPFAPALECISSVKPFMNKVTFAYYLLEKSVMNCLAINIPTLPQAKKNFKKKV